MNDDFNRNVPKEITYILLLEIILKLAQICTSDHIWCHEQKKLFEVKLVTIVIVQDAHYFSHLSLSSIQTELNERVFKFFDFNFPTLVFIDLIEDALEINDFTQRQAY